MKNTSKRTANPIYIIIAAVGINLVGGAIYCWSIIGKELIINLGWTNTEANLPYTVSIAMISIFMLIGGRLRDTLGPRIGALIGGTIAGFGLFISSFFTSPLAMTVTYGLIAGGGFGLAGSSTTVTAIKWFPDERKGIVSGICLSGIALAAVYISPIVQALIEYTGVYKTFQYMGAGTFVIIVLFALLLKDPPEAAPEPGVIEGVWKDIFKKANFYKLWLTYLLGASVGLIIIGNIAVIAVRQAAWQDGFLLVILVAVFNACGRLLSGLTLDKIGTKNTFRIVLLIQAANMALFYMYNSVVPLAAGTAVAGLCYGGVVSSIPAATAGEFGTKNLGLNYGLVATAYGCAGVLGPIMAGMIVDITGSYHYVYIVCVVLLIVSTVIISTLKK